MAKPFPHTIMPLPSFLLHLTLPFHHLLPHTIITFPSFLPNINTILPPFLPHIISCALVCHPCSTINRMNSCYYPYYCNTGTTSSTVLLVQSASSTTRSHNRDRDHSSHLYLTIYSLVTGLQTASYFTI